MKHGKRPAPEMKNARVPFVQKRLLGITICAKQPRYLLASYCSPYQVWHSQQNSVSTNLKVPLGYAENATHKEKQTLFLIFFQTLPKYKQTAGRAYTETEYCGNIAISNPSESTLLLGIWTVGLSALQHFHKVVSIHGHHAWIYHQYLKKHKSILNKESLVTSTLKARSTIYM